MKSIIIKIRDFVVNDSIILFFVYLYEKLLRHKIRKAQGRVSLQRIKNKEGNCRFNGRVEVVYPDNLYLKNGVRIGFGGFIHALGGVEIGENTQISRNVLIYSANHNIKGNAIPYDDRYVTKKVTIGSSVWIGMNVIITPGVTIGDGAVIGMGAVVSKNVLPGEIVVGARQRTIDHRDMEKFDMLNNENSLFSLKWPNN